MAHVTNPAAPILLVDDEEQALRSYDLNLRYHGYTNTVRCQDSREAPAMLENQEFSLVVLDLCMPHVSGEELLEVIRRVQPSLPSIVVTGHNEVETAVRCMRAGALNFLLKPVDRQRLLEAVDNALNQAAVDAESEAGIPGGNAPDTEDSEWDGDGLVIADPAMQEVRKRLKAFAVTEAPALILGETGVGKELAARAIHTMSGRSGRFVALNAAGLDDVFFADTLFGHEKGAYTNAQGSRTGLVDAAAGGSLFLDEIGDLSFASQLKLLRLIQEKEYYPLGSDKSRPLRARIIAATNKTLPELMDPACFRRDLFFRLRTHLVQIPPLRERPQDIPILVRHFLKRAAAELGMAQPRITPDFLALLAQHHFPGNVRELESMLYNALAVQRAETQEEADSTVRRVLDDKAVLEWMHFQQETPLSVASTGGATANGNGASGVNLGRDLSLGEGFPTLREAQERVIEEAMRRCDGNQSAAARLLGISRQALNRRLNTTRKS
ncbi:sigma-54-dependent Fis family transcriptional regulator [Oceanidesulfovibrio indonesiensis]|uniref:Sigma-54-dependent Fis family transcriptional regulator n=1 Tax=Oceanidesulfovibrio indonesiensis TaxID=54767 RepID=A0A7M3MD35_9BACT|nr:sigma-54 dependent transcriptional regulator [Oceanidesulfovibrio indonesiensis]TVM16395.1 sigma-54-dependent Fis family transcriptional regulator [Oceanidesulfovibrio indonesiensis]